MHYVTNIHREIILEVPRKTRNNGTLYMHAVLLDGSELYKAFDNIIHTESILTLPLVTHVEPQAATFNLLQQNVSSKNFYKIVITFSKCFRSYK